MVKIAIVGCGPRGLACLEALLYNSAAQNINNLSITIFEPSEFPGAGAIWDPNQRDENWINIDNHALKNLRKRNIIHLNDIVIPDFPDFDQWLEKNDICTSGNSDKLIFYPRRVMGTYLYQRLTSILNCFDNNKVVLIPEEIKNIEVLNDEVHLYDRTNKNYTFNECLLSIGHQQTELDKQMQSWQDFSKKSDAVFYSNPYDDKLSYEFQKNSIVAIRGFGLAMIDVMRLLIAQSDYEFETLKNSRFLEFKGKLHHIKYIIPFSIDGLPPVPKPFSKAVDKYFEPLEKEKKFFEKKLKELVAFPEHIKSNDFLIREFSKLASQIINKNPERFKTVSKNSSEIEELCIQWLNNMSIQHDVFINQNLPTIDYMQKMALMSYGETVFSLDYAIGQIWRHIQPTLYSVFAFTELQDKVIEDIVKLDSSTKRYTYGPPVESILQMIALAEKNILRFDLIADPDIRTEKNGWSLKKDSIEVTCNVMINSVLSPPVVKNIKTDIFKSLHKNNVIEPVTSKLGIKTNPDSTIYDDNDSALSKISIIGRNCKGSVLGTDAILECFNNHPNLWADGVISRNFN